MQKERARVQLMQIIRFRDLVPVPWKNGGGLTREVLRRPPSGAFRWRLSLAEIAASGPFSDFAGYRRVMMLLEGRGVQLRFAGGGAGALRRPGDLIEFEGALRTECELIEGPCVDLNLIIDERAPVPEIRVLRETTRLRAERTMLLVALADAIVQGAPATAPGEAVRLARGDTLWLERGAGELWVAPDPAATAATAATAAASGGSSSGSRATHRAPAPDAASAPLLFVTERLES